MACNTICQYPLCFPPCWPYVYQLPLKFDLVLTLTTLPFPLSCPGGTPLYDLVGGILSGNVVKNLMPVITPLTSTFTLTLPMKRVGPSQPGIAMQWVQDDSSYYGGSLGATSVYGTGFDAQGYAALPLPYHPVTLPTYAVTNSFVAGVTGGLVPAPLADVPFTTYRFASGLSVALVVPAGTFDPLSCPPNLLLFWANINAIEQQAPNYGTTPISMASIQKPWFSWDNSVPITCNPLAAGYAPPVLRHSAIWIGQQMQFYADNGNQSFPANYCKPPTFPPPATSCPASYPFAYDLLCSDFDETGYPVWGSGIFPFALEYVSFDLPAIVQNKNLAPGTVPFGSSPGSCCSLCGLDLKTGYTLTISGGCLAGSYPLTWSGFSLNDLTSFGITAGPQWGWAGFVNGWATSFSFAIQCSYGDPTGTQVPTYGVLASPIFGSFLIENVTCSPLVASFTDGDGITYTIS